MYKKKHIILTICIKNNMRINIFVINQTNNHKAKIYINGRLPKFFEFFSSPSIRMSGTSIDFDDKKI